MTDEFDSFDVDSFLGDDTSQPEAVSISKTEWDSLQQKLAMVDELAETNQNLTQKFNNLGQVISGNQSPQLTEEQVKIEQIKQSLMQEVQQLVAPLHQQNIQSQFNAEYNDLANIGLTNDVLEKARNIQSYAMQQGKRMADNEAISQAATYYREKFQAYNGNSGQQKQQSKELRNNALRMGSPTTGAPLNQSLPDMSSISHNDWAKVRARIKAQLDNG